MLLVVFTIVERRVKDPLIDMSLFRNRPYVLIIIGGTIANVVYTVTVLSTTIYLQDGRGLSPMIAGLVFLAPSVAVALSGPLAGRLAAWQPVPLLIPAALVFGGVCLLAVSLADAWGLYVPVLGLTGIALGLGWTLPSIGTQTVVRTCSRRRSRRSQSHDHGDDRRLSCRGRGNLDRIGRCRTRRHR